MTRWPSSASTWTSGPTSPQRFRIAEVPALALVKGKRVVATL